VSQFTALVLTLVVEVPLYTAGLVGLRLARMRRAALLGAVLNLFTHPILWWSLAPRPALPRFVVAEVLVGAAEAALLWAVLRREPVGLAALSVAANTASVLAGLAAGAVSAAAGG
jgi:hypothetical protein